jgi:cobalamin biosynthesis Mg chelatase CobN
MPDPCHICGTQPDVPRHCNHCDRSVCTEHLLPENHECVALTTRVSDEWFSDGRNPPVLGGQSGDDPATETTTRSTSNTTTDPTGEVGMTERRKRSTQRPSETTQVGRSTTQRTQSNPSQPETGTPQSKQEKKTESVISPIASRVTTIATSSVRGVWNLVSAALRLVGAGAVWAATGWLLWRGATAGVHPAVLWRPLAVLIGSIVLLRLTRR